MLSTVLNFLQILAYFIHNFLPFVFLVKYYYTSSKVHALSLYTTQFFLSFEFSILINKYLSHSHTISH